MLATRSRCFCARLLLSAATFRALLATSSPIYAQPRLGTVPIRPGMVITSSVRIARGTYRLPAPDNLDSALIVVRGDNVTVDFDGATLEGTPLASDPDRARGVAIRIEGGARVRVRNARI